MNGWITITQCPNCASANLAPYKAVNTAPFLNVNVFGGSLTVSTITQYVRCDVCGLVIQSPRVTDERITEYYSSGFYRDTLGISVEDMDKDEQKRSLEIAVWLEGKKISPKKHLDIGCSRGYFLNNVNANTMHGFDQNPAYSEKIKVISDKAKLSTYDLVSAIHVLEHVTDPIKELAWYRSLSTDKVLIEVPGENCKGGALRFAHLFYFPPDLLVSMVEAAGMTVIELVREPHTRILAKV